MLKLFRGKKSESKPGTSIHQAPAPDHPAWQAADGRVARVGELRLVHADAGARVALRARPGAMAMGRSQGTNPRDSDGDYIGFSWLVDGSSLVKIHG